MVFVKAVDEKHQDEQIWRPSLNTNSHLLVEFCQTYLAQATDDGDFQVDIDAQVDGSSRDPTPDTSEASIITQSSRL